MEKLINYYEILGIDYEDAKRLEDETFKEVVIRQATIVNEKLDQDFNSGIIDEEEFNTRKDEVKAATVVLLDENARKEYDEALEKELKEGEDKPIRVVNEEEDTKTSGKGRKILATIGIVVLAGLIIWGAKSCADKKANNKGDVDTTPQTTVEQTIDSKESSNIEEDTVDLVTPSTETTTPSTEDTTPVVTTPGTEETVPEVTTPSNTDEPSPDTTEETTNPDEDKEDEETQNVGYGDIMDQDLVASRAQQLAVSLREANVVNPVTTVPYTEEELIVLIQYANGVYTPKTMEEIDVLHLNLLNLLISPINTDDYLFHIVYVNGATDFEDVAIVSSENNAQHPARFDEALAQYGQNGVYPLIQWITEKRIAIYSTTDGEEIKRIYNEVGQVMADLMKGDGATITVVENGQEVTYTFTSEQVLANHSSAIVLTTEAQLIFANSWRRTNELGEIVDEAPQSWYVYSKFLPNNEPDVVSLEEIQAWINNGCDYEWGIEDVLIGGQTFGQRIQGDLEGMALNNYTMAHERTLTK